jgi:hypothetical protein
MPLDLLCRVPGIGAHASKLFSTTKIMKVVSHSTLAIFAEAIGWGKASPNGAFIDKRIDR